MGVDDVQVWEALLATFNSASREEWPNKAMDKIGIHPASRMLFRDRVAEVVAQFPELEYRDRVAVRGFDGEWLVSREVGLNIEALSNRWDGHRFSLIAITVPLWWVTKL